MTLLLDTHALQWLTAEPDRLSEAAAAAIDDADELAVAGITWYELAWLAERGRIIVGVPVRTWLSQLSRSVRSVGVTPAIAATAAELRPAFRGDPVDRLIFATAIENGWPLLTKDQRMHDYPQPRTVAIW